MNIYLLGGSNSIVKGGFNSGWPAGLKIVNAAIGASSSIQNLYALLGIKDSIELDDVVVTESNVNDSFNINVHGEDSSVRILENIDSFYFELSKVKCNKVVILMPFRNYLGRQESVHIVEAVNLRHINNARKYGFYLLNLYYIFSTLPEKDLRYIMADGRHPLQAIMFNVGKNIADFFTSKNSCSELTDSNVLEDNFEDDVHFRIDASELSVSCLIEKKNSIFAETVLELNNKLIIDKMFVGMELIGIGTWCDGNSSISIKSRGHEVVKKFNKLNAFNEIISGVIVDEETSLESFIGKVKITEKTTNCSNTEPTEIVKLTGLLFRKADFSVDLSDNISGSISLDHLVPDVNTFVSTIKFYLSKNEEYLEDLGLNVEKLISISEGLKCIDTEQSLYLLNLAYKVRPSISIKQRIESHGKSI